MPTSFRYTFSVINVRFGSKAEIQQTRAGCLLLAITGPKDECQKSEIAQNRLYRKPLWRTESLSPWLGRAISHEGRKGLPCRRGLLSRIWSFLFGRDAFPFDPDSRKNGPNGGIRISGGIHIAVIPDHNLVVIHRLFVAAPRKLFYYKAMETA